MAAYKEIRSKNLREKQEMKKLGLQIPVSEPIRTSPVPVVKRRPGRPPKRKEIESSDEDYENYSDDDSDFENIPKKKRRHMAIKKTRGPVGVKTTGKSEKTGENKRYPKRESCRPSYKDAYIPGSDDMLYCADCKSEWEGDCPEHGPLLEIADTPIPLNIEDASRAKKSAPSVITVADSKIPEAGSGVWAKDFIPARVRFGPYIGKIVPCDVRNGYSWLVRKNGRPHHCVDATEPGLSNWMRFVNCARYDGEQNLEAFQYGGEIYYRTLRRIKPHEELLVWYGDDYGRQLGINPNICDAEDESNWKENRFKCPVCGYNFISPLYLERHQKVCRMKKVVEKPDQTFRCIGCEVLFSSHDYLKRHKRFCRKVQQFAIPPKPEPQPQPQPPPQPQPQTRTEETRVDELKDEPSDDFKEGFRGFGPEYTKQESTSDRNLDVRNEEALSSEIKTESGSALPALDVPLVDLTAEDTDPETENNLEEPKAENHLEVPTAKTVCYLLIQNLTAVETKRETENEIEVLHNENELQVLPTENVLEILPTENEFEFIPTENELKVISTENELEGIPAENQLEVIPTKNQLEDILCENQLKPYYDSIPVGPIEGFRLSRPDSQCENCPENLIKSTIIKETEPMKMKECYVRLERIPWFSDALIAKKPFQCTNCYERFGEASEIAVHVMRHRNATLFICSSCPKTFSSRDRLTAHLEVHAKDQVDRVDCARGPVKSNPQLQSCQKFSVCSDCYKIFSKSEDLKEHYCKATTPEEPCFSPEKSTRCFECNKSFEGIQRLMLHLVTHREGKRIANLLNAKQCVTGHLDLKSFLVNGEKIFFPGCSGVCSVSHTLTTSLSLKLDEEHISTESSIQFSVKGGVDSDLTHASKMKTKPEHNNTQITLSGSLKSYFKTPRGRFVCSQCNTRFSHKSMLIVHRRIHRDIKPFICRLCKKGFLHSGSFQRHIQEHKAAQAECA